MCAEGFVRRLRKDLQLSAQIKLWFCSKLNKTQFVDVTPTLGVNHVTSGVVVSCVVSLSVVFYALITVYI